jgi:hypothetical protein
LIARSGLRADLTIRYADACRSKMNFEHHGFDHFMQSPLYAATVCILNSLSSSSVWQKAPIQTFRSLSKLPKDVGFRIDFASNNIAADQRRLRRPKNCKDNSRLVRFGSKADRCVAKSDVRFTPNSDRESGFPQKVMSALPPKTDMCAALVDVC